MTTGLELATRINDLAERRRRLLAEMPSMSIVERRQAADTLQELEAESERLQAERRAQHARVSPAAQPDRKPIIPKEPTMTFVVYERFAKGSVQAEPEPAVGFSANTLSFNQLALDALGLTVGDRLAILFDAALGRVALQLPPKGWALSRSSKLSSGAGSIPAAINGLSGFNKWAQIDGRKARGNYHLTHDADLGLWWFQLPAGSWVKPASKPGNGATSAQRRADLPATSPHRKAS